MGRAGRLGIVVLRAGRAVQLMHRAVGELYEAAGRVIPKPGHG